MAQNKSSFWFQRFPVWVLAPAVVGALALALVMFGRDYRREQGYLNDMFLGRGEMLIHSLEMVGRLRFDHKLEAQQLSEFWNNLEESENVLFIAITDTEGRLKMTEGPLKPPASIFSQPEPFTYTRGALTPHITTVKVQGRSICLVYRPFWPGPRHERARPPRRAGFGRPELLAEQMAVASSLQRRLVWVGFDLGPFEAISRSRVRTAGLFVGVFCLAALAGVLALFWGYNLSLTRRRYQDTNALAGELISRLPIGMFLVDERGLISLANRAAGSISGLPPADFIGRSLTEISGGLLPGAAAISGREMDISFTGGASVHIALTSGPVINDDGQLLGQVILMEDLGELGRLKSELAKKERLAALGSLAAGLAHEIRNPLGAIGGLTQHLLNKAPADKSDREALEVMLHSVERLNSTISNFLDYARPAVIRPQTVELCQLVKKMATLAGHDAKARQVDVKLDLPEEQAFIEADEALLSQAFLNIYLNGIEAAACRGPEARLTVSLQLKAGRAILSFRDNGPGFSAEQLAQPFVPYFTTKAKGSGLGLALVEKTIRAHQGADISLGLAPDGGALVTVSLPLSQDSGAPESDTAGGEGRQRES